VFAVLDLLKNSEAAQVADKLCAAVTAMDGLQSL